MAVTTILFKRGNSPISQVNLRPGEPGWTLDTGKLYIGIETEHGIESKLINVLDEQDVTELMAEIDAIKARIDTLHPPPTYSYTRYAIDDQGTGFSATFNPAIHKYKGVYVSLEPLTGEDNQRPFYRAWSIRNYTYTPLVIRWLCTGYVGTHSRAIITPIWL